MEEQPEVGGDLEDIPEEEQDQNMLKVPFIRKSYEFSEFFPTYVLFFHVFRDETRHFLLCLKPPQLSILQRRTTDEMKHI